MFSRRTTAMILGLLALLSSGRLWAEDSVYQTEAGFLEKVFGETPPERAFLWMKGPLKESSEKILGHRYRQLRVPYWGDSRKSTWILEEIGKVKPITLGIVVENGALASIEVLVYRESHGWEIRYPFFTEQFEGAALAENGRLDTSIDGISGATLSVNAVTKLARLALRLAEALPPIEDAAP